ncbi:MAG: GNAT family N-acetyltransferase [Trueperaceae bacterium]
MDDILNDLGQPIGFPIPDWQAPPPLPKAQLQGRYCSLEPTDVSLHARDLFEANALDKEGRNWTYLPYGPFETLSSYAQWLTATCLGHDPLFLTILDKHSNKAVGLASYIRITPNTGSIEVGHINYSPLLQKTPIATEAMYLMMRQVFELGYRRYEWKCNALNEASRNAAKRLGFTFEGVFRQANVVKGYNRDTAWYSVIDGEWPRLETAFKQWLNPKNFDENDKQRVRLSELTGV